MVQCTFCGNNLSPGSGMMYVREDGTVLYFDKRKCRVGMLTLKRIPRNIRWTKHYVKGKTTNDRTHPRPPQT